MKIALHRNSTPRAFRSAQDFGEYAAEQQKRFQSLASKEPAAYQQWGKSCFNNWAKAQQLAKDPSVSDATLSKALRDAPCLDFDGPVIELMRRLAAEGRTAAVDGVLRCLKESGDSQRLVNMPAAEYHGVAELAATLAIEGRLGNPSVGKRLGALLADHESRIAALLEEDQHELETKRGQFEELIAAIDEKRDELEKQAAEMLQRSQSNWLGAYNDYIEQLKTQTAVELWEKRSAEHRVAYNAFRKGSIIFGMSGALIGLFWIFAGFALARLIFPDDKTAQLAAYSAGSIILFTLFVWTLRVLIRSMISESHLRTDASVRAAMAHTYLALSKEEQASQEDRAIILASLFAPVSDGLVKDDGMPLFSPAAFAASAITNPGR